MLDACKDGDLPIMEFDGTIRQLGNRLLSANAYLGAEPMAQALTAGADIVITGRASDPALFLAPMIHAFGWAMDDWNLLGQGTVAGHLLECAGQITGGYFADPGYKDVADLARLGFPIGEVGEDGSLVITKVAGSGGAVTAQTCKEQLLYEVHDPEQVFPAGRGRGFLAGEGRGDRARSRPRQRRARHEANRHAEGLGRLCRQLYRRGPDLLCRPRRAGAGAAGAGDRPRTAEADRCRRERIAVRTGRRRFPARAGSFRARRRTYEVRVRVAGRTENLREAVRIGNEVETLYTNGPAAGGGAWKSARDVVAVASVLLPRELAKPQVRFVGA